METELQKFKKSPSIRLLSRNSSIVRGSAESDDDTIVYTSLKDIIVDSPTNVATIYDGNEFDSSSITIRNRLVRHAASSYIQSATIIIASRNHNFFANVWGRGRSNAESGSRWNVHVRNPIRPCFEPIYQCVVDMVTAVLARVFRIR